MTLSHRGRIAGRLRRWAPALLTLAFIAAVLAPLASTAAAQNPYHEHTAESPQSPKPGPAPSIGATTVTFPERTYLLPMDEKQNNITQAFGFAHAMLRNNTFIFRLICPPSPVIKTDVSMGGATYTGGPMLIMETNAVTLNFVKGSFLDITVHRVARSFTWNQTFVVKEPTKIIVFDAYWGKTYQLLDEMKIPYYRTLNSLEIIDHPEILDNYSMLVDDCVGMGLQPTPAQAPIINAMRNFTARGNEIIFNCYSITDLQAVFPGYIGGNRSAHESRTSTVTPLPDFPAQYPTATTVTFNGIWSQVNPSLPNVSVIAKGAQWTDACYFYFGKGIAEFFSFHPGEQVGTARHAAVTLYGNKFLHLAPVDSGLSLSAQASPKTVSLQGTSTPDKEHCVVTLTVKPLNMYVTVSNLMAVNYRLQSYMHVVPNSFTDQNGTPMAQPIQVSNPDGTTSLTWQVDYLPSSSLWAVVFKATSTQLGSDLPVNDKPASNVTYIDDFGMPVSRPFMEQKVNVVDGTAVFETQVFLFPALGMMTVAVAIYKRKHK